jgi:formylglycine-generating enzyme required for sulfatase activity
MATTATYNGDITDDTSDCRSDPVMNSIGWYCGNVGDDPLTLCPTAALAPNAYGVCDMLGNAAEWTSDVYTGASLLSNEGKKPPPVDPIGNL